MNYLVLRDTPDGIEVRLIASVASLTRHIERMPAETNFGVSLPPENSRTLLAGGTGTVIFDFANGHRIHPERVSSVNWKLPL